MRIQMQPAANQAWRNTRLHGNEMAVAMQRLSTGFRINRADDDPAGSAISSQTRVSHLQDKSMIK